MSKENPSSEFFADPTKTELAILQILWKHGPSTVRLVNDKLSEQKGSEINYTSTLKLMQIMIDKKLLKRDETSMKHIYEPSIDEAKAKGVLLNRFVDSMFEGSASSMVMQLFGNRNVSEKELEAMRKMLQKLDNQ